MPRKNEKTIDEKVMKTLGVLDLYFSQKLSRREINSFEVQGVFSAIGQIYPTETSAFLSKLEKEIGKPGGPTP